VSLRFLALLAPRTLAIAFVAALAPEQGWSQDKLKFDPSRDLDGFEQAAASQHRDLYPLKRYLEQAGQELTVTELAKRIEEWRIARDAVLKRIEAIRADPREAHLYTLERQFAAHPYFSKVRYDVDRSFEGRLFLVQHPPPGTNITRDPRKIADFYGPPMRRMEEAFVKGFVKPLGLNRRSSYAAYTLVVLTDEDEYHAFSQSTEQAWQLSAAYYEPRLSVIVAYGDPFAPDTTPALQRRLVLSEFARALQHAHFQGRAERPTSLWLNLGFASWFGWREGVLAEAKDKTAIDPDALADLARIAEDKTTSEVVLHPLFDLLQVRATGDVVLLAKQRAEAAKVPPPSTETTLRAFYVQAELWSHYLHDAQGGRHREAFLKFFQSSLSGLDGLDAFTLAFRQADLGILDREFYSDLRGEHEKLFPSVKLDRAFFDAPFADRPTARKGALLESAAATTPAASSGPAEPAFAAVAAAVGTGDVDGRHALALAQAMKGDLEGALRALEEIVPTARPPESERISREIERVKQFILLRDGWFAHLARSGDKISGKYRGQEFVATVKSVEDGWVNLGENPLGLSKVPVGIFQPFEIARQAGRKEEQGQAEPWARFWPYILAGEKKWEQLLKDDSAAAVSLREDAGAWYPQLLKTAKAAVALDEIAATPEPSNAKEAGKFLGAVKSLLSTHGDLPLVQRKIEPLRRAASSVILKAYAEQDPGKQCHGTWTTLGHGLANVVYDFAKPEEALDFRRVPDYLREYHGSLPPTVKSEADSVFAVANGEFSGTGSACYRHFVEFATPLALRFDVLFRNAPAKTGQGAFTFMIGACDDNKGSYLACLNFGGLAIADLASQTFKTFPYDEPTLSKKVFRLELRHDGSTVSTWLNGAKKFESTCAGRTNGSVFLWFHSDNPIAIQRLEIDGRVDPAWPEKARAAFFHARLEELGFK